MEWWSGYWRNCGGIGGSAIVRALGKGMSNARMPSPGQLHAQCGDALTRLQRTEVRLGRPLPGQGEVLGKNVGEREVRCWERRSASVKVRCWERSPKPAPNLPGDARDSRRRSLVTRMVNKKASNPEGLGALGARRRHGCRGDRNACRRVKPNSSAGHLRGCIISSSIRRPREPLRPSDRSRRCG